MGGPSSDAWKRLRSRILGGAGVTAAGAGYWWYYLHHICKTPQLHYHKESTVYDTVKEHCKSLQKPFRPTPWLVLANAQTIVGAIRACMLKGGYRRQLLECEDGGIAALDWWESGEHYSGGRDLPDDAPIVLVLHGVGGDSLEAYCKWMCETAASKGWRPVVLTFRGQGGLELTTPTTYCATFTDDLVHAIDSIQELFPDAPLAAVGYSLGSKLLTKYLAVFDNLPEGSRIKCAVMISNPFCLSTLHRKFEVPFTMGWLYNLGLTALIKMQSARHMDVLGRKVDLGALNECWTVRHLEETFTCKLFGYSNVDEYYDDASSINNIKYVKTPSLFLVSNDDPFLGRLPLDECERNPNTVLAVTERGGHVAFMENMWPFSQAWMDKVAAEFLTPHLCPPRSRL